MIPSQAHVKKEVFYFGYMDCGHFLIDNSQSRRHSERSLPTFPWTLANLDTGLLKKGRHKDIDDGRVFWTVGGRTEFWYAFYWWDRSGDSRSNSNSGFYVRGFGWPLIQEAFDFACAEWPYIVTRQKYPLALQLPFPPKTSENA